MSETLHVGEYRKLEKATLQLLLDELNAKGYRTVGPQLAEGAIIIDVLTESQQLPIGYLDHQLPPAFREEF